LKLRYLPIKNFKGCKMGQLKCKCPQKSPCHDRGLTAFCVYVNNDVEQIIFNDLILTFDTVYGEKTLFRSPSSLVTPRSGLYRVTVNMTTQGTLQLQLLQDNVPIASVGSHFEQTFSLREGAVLSLLGVHNGPGQGTVTFVDFRLETVDSLGVCECNRGCSCECQK
jgi:hypothetical protein